MNDLVTHTSIIGLVLVVAVASVFIVATSSSTSYGLGVTGFVVESQDLLDCSCSGYDPVCGVVGHRLETFSNECQALCEGVRIVAHTHCGNI